jgi:class 3 adenylate cyclase
MFLQGVGGTVFELVIWCGVGLAATGLVGAGATRRRRWMRRHPAPTFLFADLAGYTALTEERGDEAAAALAREFRRTMCALSREHGAWQVKSMGDGVMIWAPDAGGAVALAAQTVEQVGTRPDLLPVRVGVHTGPAVMRGCDWYGSAVNVAARLAAEAKPNEALVSATTRAAARGSLTPRLGAERELLLRGVERPIAAWRLT